MAQKFPIDSGWFVEQLKQRGRSLRGLARFMTMDAAAVSRMLNGQRGMSAAEQDRVAAFLGVSLSEIAMHRGELQSGFGEKKQEGYLAGPDPVLIDAVEMFTEADIIQKDGKEWIQGPDGLLPLHPIFGCMKGTMIIPPDLDLTAPIDDVEWSDKIYNA
jgi:transcriptional regulator with XRE-family HTH domain